MTAPERSDHLLPVNATPLERALSASDARILLAPHNVIRWAWDPDLCPVHLLPYLAAAWSVDEWDPAWGEAAKRQAIRDSVWIHQHKGTVGALRRALAQVGLAATVSEWFQHGGAPYTFRLRVALAAGAAWRLDSLRRLMRVAIGAKNVRSWLDRVTVVAPPPAPTPVGTAIGFKVRIKVRTILEPVFAAQAPPCRMPVMLGTYVRIRARVNPS